MPYSRLSIYLCFLVSIAAASLCNPAWGQQAVPAGCGEDTAPAIGQRCGDVVFGGVSDGSYVYVEALPRGELHSWERAKANCAALGPQWRLPTKAELTTLYVGRDVGALAGTFDAGWHWSSTQLSGLFTPSIRSFVTGEQGTASTDNAFAARCVQTVSVPIKRTRERHDD
ncbi:MAG: DUF1566 domain-containing protein [Maricaulaceae bacterium]|nr:DUF1566 domain-containing protein [Maricaulaceae bacterium]